MPVAHGASRVAPALLLVVSAAACSGRIDPAEGASPHQPAPGSPGGPSASGSPGTPGSPNTPGSPGTPAGPGSPGGGPAAPIPGVAPARCQGQPPRPGPTFIRRLTRTEYNNTVRDLLGDTTRPASTFAPEDRDRVLGFDNNAATMVVSPLLAEQYMGAAEQLATRAVERLDKLLPCDPVAEGDACVRRGFELIGKRAWRRPLASAELTELMALHAAGKAGGGVKGGVRLALVFLLQAPEFFYRIELGAGAQESPGVVRLSPWETASRLSYELWNSMPDDELLAAAEAGKLGTADAVAVQARRLLADGRAKDAIAKFHEQWLALEKLDTLEKDRKAYPAYAPELRQLFRSETQTFLDRAISDDGKFTALLTGAYTYMNARLAQFYGASGPAGAVFERVATDPARRAGLLTQASFLATEAKANQTSPVHRGKFVREQLLCTPPPAPPPDLEVIPPDLDPKLTTRERFLQHQTNPACSGCHKLMDQIGLGFETYDGIGLWRSTENGKSIDATGVLVASDVDGQFIGAVDLQKRLAGSAQVEACFATQWFRFAYGRNETPEDECTVARLASTVRAGTVKDLIVALTQTDAFLYRKIPGGAP